MNDEETPARSVKKRVWKEGTPGQRAQAAGLFAQGVVQADVARQVGVSKSTVCRWHRDWESRNQQEVGPAGHRGGVCKLSPEQLEVLKRELVRGPGAHGYPTQLWTLSRIRQLIEELFGVSYQTGSVWYVMQQIGFSAQKPIKRGMERNEEAIEEWKKTAWKSIQEKGGA